jgi:hypothetical protein
MATSRPLLDRLLNTPDLAKLVPYRQPEVLHRVIQCCGLEWRVRRQGGDEEFDADRFGVWLEVLMQSGAGVAAQKLMGLDIALVTAGFARHSRVFDQIRCRDRDTQLRLNGLRHDLTQHVGNRAPWRARNALDILVRLDGPSWAALDGLIAECPVMHAAISAPERRCRTIDAAHFEFIATNGQIGAAHKFLESLPSTWTR